MPAACGISLVGGPSPCSDQRQILNPLQHSFNMGSILIFTIKAVSRNSLLAQRVKGLCFHCGGKVSIPGHMPRVLPKKPPNKQKRKQKTKNKTNSDGNCPELAQKRLAFEEYHFLLGAPTLLAIRIMNDEED